VSGTAKLTNGRPAHFGLLHTRARRCIEHSRRYSDFPIRQLSILWLHHNLHVPLQFEGKILHQEEEEVGRQIRTCRAA